MKRPVLKAPAPKPSVPKFTGPALKPAAPVPKLAGPVPKPNKLVLKLAGPVPKPTKPLKSQSPLTTIQTKPNLNAK